MAWCETRLFQHALRSASECTGGQDIAYKLQVRNGNMVVAYARAIQPSTRFPCVGELTLDTSGERFIGIRFDRVWPPGMIIHSYDIEVAIGACSRNLSLRLFFLFDCFVLPKNISSQVLSVLYLAKWLCALIAIQDRSKLAGITQRPWLVVQIAYEIQRILLAQNIIDNAVGAPFWSVRWFPSDDGYCGFRSHDASFS